MVRQASRQGERTRLPETKRLMEAVVERENMIAACKRVIGEQGSAGVDGMTVDDLRAYLQRALAAHQGRTAGRAVSAAAGAAGGDTEAGRQGMRQLGIPTVVDRLIQQALHQVLQPDL